MMLSVLRSRVAAILGVAGLALAMGASARPQSTPSYDPPQHTLPPPAVGASPADYASYADQGMQIERDRGPQWELAEHRRLDRALAALQPQRKGVVDAYVVAVALDSDPVFGREAREAGKVLSRRYDAAGRTIVLAGSDGSAESGLPRGSPETLSLVLARIAELMDPKEDVLVLYTTSHGAPLGIVYNDGNQGYGAISPARLWNLFGTLGIEKRLVIISACYSGVFVPMLATEDSVVITAASSERTSFGCQADSDWTFFGDALINHALRKPQPLAAADDEAKRLIVAWEAKGRLTPSDPQISIGAKASTWLAALDRRTPGGTTPPVGRPAVTLLDTLAAR